MEVIANQIVIRILSKWETQCLQTWEGSDSCGFNPLKYFLITALELANSGYSCDVLSTGQLPIQISQLCTHNVLLRRASLSGWC